MTDTDLADLLKQCVNSVYLCTENVSKYLNEDKEAELAKLKSYVEVYCGIEAKQESAPQALATVKKETDMSNIHTLQERFVANLENIARKNYNTNNHPYMIKMQKRIERGMLVRGDALEESDLAITESQNKPIDPITKRPIEDPVKNTVCGHVYEREAIMNLILMKENTKCPVVGCVNRGPIVPGHLISDEELKFKMALISHSTMIQEQSMMNLDDSD